MVCFGPSVHPPYQVTSVTFFSKKSQKQPQPSLVYINNQTTLTCSQTTKLSPKLSFFFILLHFQKITMDWFSWLSRTNLEASLIYEYGLSFSNNELEYEDIIYFNHEFLQSMGISIAKHRLEILKLARRDRKPSPLTARSIFRVLIAIKKTGKCFSEYVRAWIRREESSRALVVVSRSSSGNGRWKGALLKRKKRSVMVPSNGNGEKEERLLLTNGTPCRLHSFSNPKVSHYEDGQDIKWDSMFQNLKPT